jgi:hypothetical protein
MSWNSPGWIPGAPHRDDVPVCGRCGHHADAHHDAVSCSVRDRWWRRCRCSGYTRFDPAAPPAAGPSSSVARHDQVMAVDVRLEDSIRGIEGLVGGYLHSPQDEATRQALLAELEKLDDQTARADAYKDLRAVAVRYQVPRSELIGATSDTSTGEDVPGAEFKAQVALVKAAKEAIRNPTTEARSALRRASDELAEVRRCETAE